MAVPADKTVKTLTGNYTMNKSLSGSVENILALQGIGYLTRKGISMATISLDVNVYEAPPTEPNTSTDLVTHIDIIQSASSLSNTHEKRCVDNTFRPHSDWLFGNCRGKSNWMSVDDIEDDFLKQGWDIEDKSDKALLMSFVENVENGWGATQIWGFQIVNGERMYCRNILITKGDKRVTERLVYNFDG